MRDNITYMESIIGENIVITNGLQKKVFIGNVARESLVYEEKAYDIYQAVHNHQMITEHVIAYPKRYSRKRREDIFKDYTGEINLVRAGYIEQEAEARRIADKYGLPLSDLEEALIEGKQKIAERRQKHSKLVNSLISQKDRLLILGLTVGLPLLSEASGISQNFARHEHESVKAVSTSYRKPEEVEYRIALDLIAMLTGTLIGAGAILSSTNKIRNQTPKKK